MIYHMWKFNKDKKKELVTLTDKQLLQILLKIAGGGLSTSQTMTAMRNKQLLDLYNRYGTHNVLTLVYKEQTLYFQLVNNKD